jgi:tetratricopeptide (TPR) repeat protein
LKLDPGAATKRARPAWYVWAPLPATGVFALGVLVGNALHAPSPELAAVAEPRPAAPAPGAAPATEEPATPPLARRDEPPAQKRVQSRRALTTSVAPSEALVESESEPLSPVTGEIALANPAEWEQLAEAGDFAAAKLALDRDGGFERARGRASAAQLLVLADIARASGSRDQATKALRRVLSSYVSAPEAPLAAWTLGNLLEQAGDRAGAAEAYATYRRLSPTGDFAEDAAARQVDAALSQGNLELGRRAMEEYAENFPKGRRLAELRKRLASLEAPLAGAAADPNLAGAQPGEPAEPDDDDAVEPRGDAPAAPVPARER